MNLRPLALLLLAACGGGGASSGGQPEGGGPSDAGRDAPSAREAGASDDGPREARADARSRVDAGSDAPGAPATWLAYASGYGPDIEWLSVDQTTGALEAKGQIAAFGPSPSFLAFSPDVKHLYAVNEATPGQVGAYAVDPVTGSLTFLNSVSSGGDGPPFVSVDATGKFVFAANYGDGSVSVLPTKADGSLGAAVQTLTVGAMAHMIIADPTNHFVFVPCLGADYVAQFLFDDTTGLLTPNAQPTVAAAAGAGPRHLAFHPNGRFAYLINETNSTLGLYAFDATHGTLTEVQTVSTLPSTFSGTNTAAEVHVHPSGDWVIGSNRGDDSLVVFAVDPKTGMLTLTSFAPSGGMTPRDFTIDPSGTFVYAANQGTGNVVPFRFDAKTGALTAVDAPVTLTMASFVGVAVLPGG